ncbi:recombinase RecA [Blastopirellula sp. JC732]|uniref:Recombinase RecA n=1 Tax=Blastopirellula sediminis TaxID=2894196 RepID=A0A9X1SFI9_9BACT|nr:ATPase domain-containing protein [Blastopirellula sediminis]MCC9609658.1 recombinase RecA [Blastopirellula sediminis]MCC9627566.1 recombinase RecA [Blastopirellula sediminis]
MQRQTTGVPGLDELLGGGLVPGTLTVIVGATGIGKTQFGVHFAHAGVQQEGRSGVFFDMSSRGDSQNHAAYAQRMVDWKLTRCDSQVKPNLDDFFADDAEYGNFLHVFDYVGKRVTKRDLDWDAWHEWQGELNEKLATTIGFLYGNLCRGSRRIVIDGIEPVDTPSESIQFNLFEYVYHQIVRKDPMWVARDLFRQKFREHSAEAERHKYDPAEVGCVLLQTSKEAMLDDLISRPLDEGDILSGANTIIYLGKFMDGRKLRRAMYVPKHRGSAVTDEIVPYTIDDAGLHFEG